LAVQNYPSAILFILISVVTGLRYYFNAAVVLEESGNLDMIDDMQKNLSDREKWREQSRLSEIIGTITRGRSRGPWMAVLGVFGFILIGLFAGALGTAQVTNAKMTSKTTYVYLHDFHYEQRNSLQYPTCQLSNDLGVSPLTKMADYAYLAGLAYRDIGSTQAELDGWFNGTALDNNELVQTYRTAVNLTSEVSFKLITFPAKGNFAFMTIRGTQNNWDMLTDVQLWSAAKLMQVLRQALPFGTIWTPIMPTLINAITKLESGNIQKISFYKDTTAFAKTILNLVPANFSGVAVTGHSLGGGLSLITGAQTGIPAVGLSAPNAMLSRKVSDVGRSILRIQSMNPTFS
jgi:lipase ATG15